MALAATVLATVSVPLATYVSLLFADEIVREVVSHLHVEPFKDGETVCFLGDSITASGRYQTMISNYYLTRFPERTVRFRNAGRSGDTSSGALKRLQEDVIDKTPTSVAIMFGMNDVSRGSYVANPDETKLASQQQALDRYSKNMAEVVARIRAEANEPKLLFITPSPFDQTVVLDRKNQLGCNDGLGRCADIVRELAAKNGGSVVDFHGPMTALNLEQQKQTPTWTIVGSDRVHPGASGHLMMAWLFLKAQGVPSIVSNVAVDASTAHTTKSVNAAVTAVTKEKGGVRFTVLANALPYPVEFPARSILSLLPIAGDLNQELLTINGLATGDYELRIDDMAVGQYTAKELATGINLGFAGATPQFKQAQTVARHNEQRRDAESQACSLLNTRRWMKSYYKVDVDDPAAVQAHADHFTDKKAYNAGMARRYIAHWPGYGDLRKQAAAHEEDALASRTPQPHVYAVGPVKGE